MEKNSDNIFGHFTPKKNLIHEQTPKPQKQSMELCKICGNFPAVTFNAAGWPVCLECKTWSLH